MTACRATDIDHGLADPRMQRYFAGTHHPHRSRRERAGFLALDGGAIIGYIAGHRSARYGCGGEIQYLFVSPPYRRHGVASELMRLLAQWFAARGVQRVCVNVNDDSPAARPFYDSSGAQPLRAHWMVWEDIAASAAPRSSS